MERGLCFITTGEDEIEEGAEMSGRGMIPRDIGDVADVEAVAVGEESIDDVGAGELGDVEVEADV